jgi:tetratricopeptide (TPR) repeat protein
MIRHDKKRISGIHDSLLKAMKNNDPDQCPSSDQLAGYLLNELSGRKQRKIEDHLVFCPFCLEALEAVQGAEEADSENSASPKNWSAIEKKLDRNFYARLQKVPAVSRRQGSVIAEKNVRRFEKTIRLKLVEIFRRPMKWVYGGAFAVMVIVCLYSYAYLSRGRTFSLAKIEPEKITQLRAGIAESNFTEGMHLYGLRKYGKAIVHLENFVKGNPNHYAAHYYLGISRLADAEIAILGLPYRFNASKVDKGISNLEKARLLGAGNPYYTADCYWYLGKACLMKNEPEKARAWFIALMKLNTPYPERKEDARRMVSALDLLRKN